MEQMAVNAVSQGQELQANGLGRLQRGLAAGVVTNMDAFALVFQQMAEAMNQSSDDNLLPGMSELPQQEEKKDEKGQNVLLSMQELAALMMVQSEQTPQITEVTPEQAEALLNGMGAVQENQAENVIQEKAPEVTPIQAAPMQVPTVQVHSTQVQENQSADVVTTAVDVRAAISGQRLPAVETEQKDSTPVGSSRKLSAEADTKQPLTADLTQVKQSVERPIIRPEEGEHTLFDGENQFKSAVEQARKQLDGKSRVEDKDLGDTVEPLNTPAPKTLSAATTVQKAEPHSQAPRLAQQIDAGVKENLALGKNEFTMKLKPEALGEITVKLVEKAGKAVLTITTASPQTAKLINNDLAALREAVKPMAVEVHEAVSQPDNSAQAQMQQFNMSGQQFAQQQQHAQSERHIYSGTFAGEDLVEEPEAADQVLEASGLDTYI